MHSCRRLSGSHIRTSSRCTASVAFGCLLVRVGAPCGYGATMFPRHDGLRVMEFGTRGAMRDRLVALVLHGNKRATAGLLTDYEAESEVIEHVGERLAMVDNDGQHVGTLLVTRVEIVRFADVPDEFALAEAEGDLDASDFRASHQAYWASVGNPVDDDTLVVTLYFDLVPVDSGP